MLDYAVIGTGWITASFISGAELDGSMRLAAVLSRSEEKGKAFAAENGCEKVFTDINALAGSDIPAVYIASPNALHTRQAELLLKSGKHVICEKPITVTPAELEKLNRIADENNAVFVEAIMYMFSPIRQKLTEAIGKIGRISSAHIDFSQLSSKYPAFLRGELPNIFNPKMATGCLEDLGIYCVYPAVDLFGVPDSLIASSSFMKTGADASGAAIFGYGGKTVTLTYSKTGQDHAGSEIFGDLGTVMIDSVSKLTDIKIVYSNGETELICGDIPKPRLMGNEATGFRKIIEDREGQKDFYALLRRRALEVSRVMEDIRNKAGIKFDYTPIA